MQLGLLLFGRHCRYRPRGRCLAGRRHQQTIRQAAQIQQRGRHAGPVAPCLDHPAGHHEQHHQHHQQHQRQRNSHRKIHPIRCGRRRKLDEAGEERHDGQQTEDLAIFLVRVLFQHRPGPEQHFPEQNQGHSDAQQHRQGSMLAQTARHRKQRTENAQQHHHGQHQHGNQPATRPTDDLQCLIGLRHGHQRLLPTGPRRSHRQRLQ